MWEKIKSVIERHPYASALGVFVVGLIVILFLTRSSGSSSGAATTAANNGDAAAQASVEEAQIQAGAGLQAAQAGYASQDKQTAAQLTALQTNDATQLAIASLQAAFQTNADNNATNVQVLSIGSTNYQAGVAADLQKSLATTAAGVKYNDDQTQEYLAGVQHQELTDQAVLANQTAYNHDQATIQLLQTVGAHV